MTDKDLRKLSRKQLLELLLKQTQRADELEKRLMETEKRLADKKLILAETGSIAEASLKLNGIFEAAQEAADQYLENVMYQAQANKFNPVKLHTLSKSIKGDQSNDGDD